MRWVIAVTAATMATYAIRLGSTRLAGGSLTPRARRALRLAAVAVLASLAVSNFPTAGGGALTASLLGVIAAVVTARCRPNPSLVMGVGVAVFGVVDLVTG